MTKRRLLVAIAAAIIELAHCQFTKFPFNKIESTLICFLTFGFVLVAFYLKDEWKEVVQENKRKKSRPVNIVYCDCEKERRIKEFQAERQKFFDDYFARSSITMTETKSKT